MQKATKAPGPGVGSTLRTLSSRFFRAPLSSSSQGAPAATAARTKPASAVAPLIDDLDTGTADVRLLIFADGPGATQIISFDLPLRKEREAGRLRLRMLSEADFQCATAPDADELAETVISDFDPTHVIVSRFGDMGTSGIVTACQRRGLPFVMHLDDNLFAVPEALGASKFRKYNDPARLGRLRLLCERAQTIYASTAELGRQISALGFTTPVVAGEIYCSAPAIPVPYTPPATPVIGYMGTAGHAADLDMIVPAIVRILEKYPDARFETFGSIKMPKTLAKTFGERVAARPAAASYLEFVQLFQTMNWTCGLAPLQDTRFNACKANTKFIEYTVAGMPCIASDTIVYRDSLAEGRGLLARTPEDWFDAMESIINNPIGAHSMLEKAQSALHSNWSADALRDQLIRICNLPAALRALDQPSG